MRGPTTIIDRYVLRQFGQIFLICFVSLTGLYIVFDAFSNLDEFLNSAESEGGLVPLLAGFYLYKSVFFFDRTSGILTMIAAMFTITWLQRHNELTALMAAGVSRPRVVAPLVGAAVGLSLLTAANREMLIPSIRHELSRNPKDLTGDSAQPLTYRYDYQTDILFRGRYTMAKDQRIHEPDFLLPPRLMVYGPQIVAENAFHRPAVGDRPAGYLFQGVRQPVGLAELESLPAGGPPIIITPRDAPDWLAPNECFVVSDVNFEQLTGGHMWRQFASTAEMIRSLRNPSLDALADVRVSIHTRFLQPVMDMTLLFLGIPLVLARGDRNLYLAVGRCVVTVSLFMLVVVGCQQLGSNYLLDPALAAWLPLMIFIPLAVALAGPLRE